MKKKRGQNSQNGIDFVNRNYRETLSNAGTEDSFQNSRGGVTLRYGQKQENGVALPVRASYSTNSDGMAVSGLVGNILYDENFTASKLTLLQNVATTCFKHSSIFLKMHVLKVWNVFEFSNVVRASSESFSSRFVRSIVNAKIHLHLYKKIDLRMLINQSVVCTVVKV